MRDEKPLILQATNEKLDKCPACYTTGTAPTGRLELTLSIPLCGRCGAAVAEALASPHGATLQRRLALDVACLLGELVGNWLADERRAAGSTGPGVH